MQKSTSQKNIDDKIIALRKIMRTLDAMSTVQETALAIVRGQFSEVLTMFLRKDLNDLLGDNSESCCKLCSYVEDD